ncbi:hypothetical protein [Mycolicibacterium hippocampi]|uniref:Uncharacterized protein n=1 Tax=Mycolicibacterium hippocampi TaxID=659824 RepID=A0A7I9ZRL5_9MYCO|nr:hypothetical protein [Mycolicibacterium hippocampi]GFH03383.1 hypothetical protein MHIP_38660 [Mycolicibacterium hippocampi]
MSENNTPPDLRSVLRSLSITGLQDLAGELAIMGESKSPGVARWATAWWWHTAAELGRREAGDGSLTDLTDVELDVLARHINEHAEPTEAGGWLRHAATAMAGEHLDRAYAKGRTDAEFQTIAAEEARRAREGRPEADLTGLPSWSDLSTGKATGPGIGSPPPGGTPPPGDENNS